MNKIEIALSNEQTNKKDALTFLEVSKKFRNKVALDKINFSVKAGEFHGFIGSNGAGKTTTIRALLGYYNDIAGEIFINGILSTKKEAKAKIGFIPEIANFPKALSSREFLYYFACMSGLDKKIAKVKVEEALKKFNMDGDEFKGSPYFFSSGQKKKIMLIQALINDPEILILDEPTANLDVASRIDFYEKLAGLHKQGKTIFISSHNLAELEKYVDSFTIIERGNVIMSQSLKKDNQQNFNWTISVKAQDITKCQNLLKNLKIKYFLNQSNNSFILFFEDDQIKKTFVNKITANNIEFSNFSEYRPSLQQLYLENTNLKNK
ncbi:ABC transporter ATP-binding protein [Metamycoplasma arthritidis]|uniref:ABC transporter ATP-binding protein n=1 Tax=Metamycoplasma arthritidis (strain 158L3-1) TaxID=243272 RepID=B3PMX4_META1|nr:ABC transporter ATP-binding protein [Metamycoplasma arthritidis]ACF07376.1 ABC transporter ATP-binding protein [Metamycoplasma arthritidis 158L3-1]VEU78895.1 ABC transporter ATP-binding protein [Metamycoplasma arthritidis]